jgi:mannose-1-phosphate guanylyltransferase
MRIIPVILSGGGGTRLWPMSTPECPKQFQALAGDQTMFQMTAERTRDPNIFTPPMIVTGAAHAQIAGQQLNAIGIDTATLLLEPCARNTAPAIALAALAAEHPEAPLLVMPSDHVIADTKAFLAAVDAALPLVMAGWLATFGITATSPETGYGYIQMADEIGAGVNRVARFVEKPDAEKAAEMIASGDHVWNGGIFLFRADHYLAALAEFSPAMLAAAKNAMENAARVDQKIYPDMDAFAASPSDSIDYAVMEKADKVAVVPANIGWSDLGSWDALYELEQKPQLENILEIDGNGNLIRSDGIRIHTAGVEDMIIIANGNDLLIVPRGKSQDVKKIVEALQKKAAPK